MLGTSNGTMPNKIVYDCIDPSPYYDYLSKATLGNYIDDDDILEMPSNEDDNHQ